MPHRDIEMEMEVKVKSSKCVLLSRPVNQPAAMGKVKKKKIKFQGSQIWLKM